MKNVLLLVVLLAATPALADPVPEAAMPSPRAESVRRTTSTTLKMAAGASALAAVGFWVAATQKEARDVKGAGATATWAAVPGAIFVACTLTALGLDGSF